MATCIQNKPDCVLDGVTLEGGEFLCLHHVPEMIASLVRRQSFFNQYQRNERFHLGQALGMNDAEPKPAALIRHARDLRTAATDLLQAMTHAWVDKHSAVDVAVAEGKLGRLLAGQAAPLPPVDMLIYCPQCRTQHIDQPQPEKGWTNPPHTSHECQECGYTFRHADVPTNGVAQIATTGKRDQDPAPHADDGWAWVRAKLEACCAEFTVKRPRADKLRGTKYEVMGWLHIVCSNAVAGYRTFLDIGIEQTTRAADLEKEVVRLRKAIAKHHTARGHERCWINDQELYRAVGLPTDGWPALPEHGEFLRRCEEYYSQQAAKEERNGQ